MKRALLLVCMAWVSMAAIAAGPFTSLHPEEAIPDPTEQVAAGAYDDLIKRMQAKLRELGFDAGPVNGDFGFKTQAALAQFQPVYEDLDYLNTYTSPYHHDSRKAPDFGLPDQRSCCAAEARVTSRIPRLNASDVESTTTPHSASRTVRACSVQSVTTIGRP
jgi:hypothetical protein